MRIQENVHQVPCNRHEMNVSNCNYCYDLSTSSCWEHGEHKGDGNNMKNNIRNRNLGTLKGSYSITTPGTAYYPEGRDFLKHKKIPSNTQEQLLSPLMSP